MTEQSAAVPPPPPPPGPAAPWDAVPPPPPAPLLPPPPPPPVARRTGRQVLRAVLRWTAAAVAFAVAGAGAAYAVTVPHRSDLPGLATPPDGRWTFPHLVPVGKGLTTDGTHATDLRHLLLPAPAGARADRTLPGRTGWLPGKDFAARYAEPSDERLRLAEFAARHLAAAGWTMPDGTHERVYLIQFATDTDADSYETDLLAGAGPSALPGAVSEADTPGHADGLPQSAFLNVYDNGRPAQRQRVHYGYVLEGDTVALVEQEAPRPVPGVSLEQSLVLQAQLLG